MRCLDSLRLGERKKIALKDPKFIVAVRAPLSLLKLSAPGSPFFLFVIFVQYLCSFHLMLGDEA